MIVIANDKQMITNSKKSGQKQKICSSEVTSKELKRAEKALEQYIPLITAEWFDEKCIRFDERSAARIRIYNE